MIRGERDAYLMQIRWQLRMELFELQNVLHEKFTALITRKGLQRSRQTLGGIELENELLE